MEIIKNNWLSLTKALFIAMGALWLPIEAYEGLEAEAPISIWWFVCGSVLLGCSTFAIDGYYISGFLRNEISIPSNGFDTNISIRFGDIFDQDGWKAIAVNDFFDSQVDDVVIAKNSLHGYVIRKYWSDKNEEWQTSVNASLKGLPFKRSNRNTGNKKRYPIGSTAQASVHNQKFLFTALGYTDEISLETSADAEALINCVRGMLKKARTVCSNQPLNIPLMGTGLGRVGSKVAIVIDLILVAIFEETKQSKVTDNIVIVISKDKSAQVNLASIAEDWK